MTMTILSLGAFCRRMILLPAAALLFAAAPLPAHAAPAFLCAEGPFALSLPLDAALAGAGIALNAGCAVVLGGNLGKDAGYDGGPFFREDVNPFDRQAMNPYSGVLDSAGTVAAGISAAAPLLMLSAPKSELFTIGVMYAESQLFANGTKNMVKAFVRRPRPYMYFEGAPQDKIDGGDWCSAFPSGHTTVAFAGASFLSFVFCAYFPDSPYKVPVVAASCALAAGTAALRILSGNHFLSDVIAGAAIGTASGIAVPLAHLAEGSRRRAHRAEKAGIQVVPTGAVFYASF